MRWAYNMLPLYAARTTPPMDTPARTGLLDVLRRTTFRSLRHRNYRLYFYGQIVSLTGSWMQSAALMWLVYDQTADPIWPPLLLVAQVGPTLLLGPLGGSLADRFPKRSLIIGTQGAFLISSVLLTFLVASNWVTPWLLFAVAVGNGVVQSIDLPARLSYVPDLIPRDDLINAVSLNAMLFNAARAVGPALSGGLFLLADWLVAYLPGSRAVTLGAVWCFALNALSYLAVLAALRRIDAPNTPRAKKSEASSLAGFRYVWERKRLAALLLSTALVSVFGWPTLTLFPPYTKLVLQHAEKEYSLLVSAIGFGALLAALTTATFGSTTMARRFLVGGSVLCALGILGLAVVHTMATAAACAAVFGYGMILYLSTGQGVLQLGASDEARGRVMALWPMTLSGGAVIGHLLCGWAARFVPIPVLMLVMASGVGLTAVFMTVFAIHLRHLSGSSGASPPEQVTSVSPKWVPEFGRVPGAADRVTADRRAPDGESSDGHPADRQP
jgi:MFS family permease